jgi:hypothetical protein
MVNRKKPQLFTSNSSSLQGLFGYLFIRVIHKDFLHRVEIRWIIKQFH